MRCGRAADLGGRHAKASSAGAQGGAVGQGWWGAGVLGGRGVWRLRGACVAAPWVAQRSLLCCVQLKASPGVEGAARAGPRLTPHRAKVHRRLAIKEGTSPRGRTQGSLRCKQTQQKHRRPPCGTACTSFAKLHMHPARRWLPAHTQGRKDTSADSQSHSTARGEGRPDAGSTCQPAGPVCESPGCLDQRAG